MEPWTYVLRLFWYQIGMRLPIAIRRVLDDTSNNSFVKIEGGIAQMVINSTRNQLEDVYRNGRRSVYL